MARKDPKHRQGVREEFGCSSAIDEALRVESRLTDVSQNRIVAAAVEEYLAASGVLSARNDFQNNYQCRQDKASVRTRVQTFRCSPALRDAIHKLGTELSNEAGRAISNDEVIRRALYRFFAADNDEDLEESICVLEEIRKIEMAATIFGLLENRRTSAK